MLGDVFVLIQYSYNSVGDEADAEPPERNEERARETLRERERRERDAERGADRERCRQKERVELNASREWCEREREKNEQWQLNCSRSYGAIYCRGRATAVVVVHVISTSTPSGAHRLVERRTSEQHVRARLHKTRVCDTTGYNSMYKVILSVGLVLKCTWIKYS